MLLDRILGYATHGSSDTSSLLNFKKKRYYIEEC